MIERRLGVAAPLAATVAVIAGYGTLSLPYATVLSNHVPCGAAAVGTLYFALRSRISSAHAFAAGACTGGSIAYDPGALAIVLLPFMVMPRKAGLWVAVVAGAAPFIFLQIGYDLRFTGNIVPPALNASVWNFPGSPFGGIQPLSVHSESLAYGRFALNLLTGNRGLFSCCVGPQRLFSPPVCS